MVFVNEKDKKPWRTVDRERNISLYHKGDIPHGGGTIFELQIEDKPIEFGAYYEIKPVSENESSIKWRIFQIKIPQGLNLDKERLRQIITEALNEYGFLFQRKNIQTINVDISPNISNL